MDLDQHEFSQMRHISYNDISTLFAMEHPRSFGVIMHWRGQTGMSAPLFPRFGRFNTYIGAGISRFFQWLEERVWRPGFFFSELFRSLYWANVDAAIKRSL